MWKEIAQLLAMKATTKNKKTYLPTNTYNDGEFFKKLNYKIPLRNISSVD